MLRSAAGGAVIQAGFGASVCVRLGVLRGEASRISQDTREAGVRKTSARVSVSSQQLASHHSAAPLGIPTPGTATPEDAPQRGGVRVLPSTPFRLTLAPPLRAPALLGQLDRETYTPVPEPTQMEGRW